MGESKHTPTSWKLLRRDSDSVAFRISNGDRTIATKEVWLDLVTPEELAEVESELRKATAAPLMLEALRKWEDFGLKMWGQKFTPETIKEFSELWATTSGAIKAATRGET